MTGSIIPKSGNKGIFKQKLKKSLDRTADPISQLPRVLINPRDSSVGAKYQEVL